ncbi:hypothetical protein D3C72_1451520 [compost metagenome]
MLPFVTRTLLLSTRPFGLCSDSEPPAEIKASSTLALVPQSNPLALVKKELRYRNVDFLSPLNPVSLTEMSSHPKQSHDLPIHRPCLTSPRELSELQPSL